LYSSATYLIGGGAISCFLPIGLSGEVITVIILYLFLSKDFSAGTANSEVPIKIILNCFYS